MVPSTLHLNTSLPQFSFSSWLYHVQLLPPRLYRLFTTNLACYNCTLHSYKMTHNYTICHYNNQLSVLTLEKNHTILNNIYLQLHNIHVTCAIFIIINVGQLLLDYVCCNALSNYYKYITFMLLWNYSLHIIFWILAYPRNVPMRVAAVTVDFHISG